MRIYKTINLINGKIYVGQDYNNRDNYLGSGKIILKAIKKYKKENFKKEILEECNSQEELDEKENDATFKARIESLQKEFETWRDSKDFEAEQQKSPNFADFFHMTLENCL